MRQLITSNNVETNDKTGKHFRNSIQMNFSCFQKSIQLFNRFILDSQRFKHFSLLHIFSKSLAVKKDVGANQPIISWSESSKSIC